MLREISGPVRPAVKCGAHVHKELGMVDVRNVKCDVAGCDKQPYFNFPDVRPATNVEFSRVLAFPTASGLYDEQTAWNLRRHNSFELNQDIGLKIKAQTQHWKRG